MSGTVSHSRRQSRNKTSRFEGFARIEELEARLLLSTAPGCAGTAGHSQTLADLPVAAQSAISSDIGRDQVQYHAAADAGGLSLANPANGFTARLQSGALVVDSGADCWRMSLEAFGFGEGVGPVVTAGVSTSDNRVDCDYGAIDEWFVNGPAGLEQGFTLAHSSLPASGGSSLTVELVLGGTLVAAANAAGNGLTLTRPDGSTALGYTGLTACDATGHALPATMEVVPVGSGQELLIHVNTAGAQGAITIDPMVQAAKLTASDGVWGDALGCSVSVDGNTVVVGAKNATVGSNLDQGAAYVFVKSGSGWSNMTQVAKLTASDGAAYVYFGSAVAVSGNTVVVGRVASQNEAYVFVEPGSGWSDMTQTAKLTPSDAAFGGGFGDSVAISGNTVVLGAEYSAIGGAQSQGAAYVFVEPGSGWSDMTQTAKLTASDGVTEAHFGNSVAVSGNTVVVGEIGATIGGHAAQGAAYVFVESGSGWSDMTQTAKLIASDGATEDQFGWSVGVSGDTVVAGAYQAKVGANSGQGAAYVFVEPGSGWSDMTQTAKLTASDGAANDYLGISVAISGDTVVAGAYTATIGANSDQGAAYVFVEPGSSWTDMTQTAKLTSSDGTSGDNFADSVAISVSTVVVGAYSAMVGGSSEPGAAYVYTEMTAPSISGVGSTASDGTYKAGRIIPITVAFSGNVTVSTSGGTPDLSLNDGGTAAYVSGSGTSTLTFNYTVASGQSSAHLDYASASALALNGGTLQDASGDDADLTLASPGASGSLGAGTNIVIDTASSPVVTVSAGAVQYPTEISGSVAVDSGIAVSDVNSAALAGATIAISGNYAGSQDVLGFASQNGITGSWNSVTGVLTLSGSSSVANYQAALRSVTYNNFSASPSLLTRTVRFVVDDGSTANNLSAPVTRTINVTYGYVDLTGVFGTPWTLPSAIVAGKALAGYTPVLVSNIGDVALPAGQLVNIQVVARDTTNTSNPDITLTTLKNQSVSRLAANGSLTFRPYVSLPAGVPADSYRIFANIIPVQALAEMRTDNNQVSQTATAVTETVTATAPFVDLTAAFGTTLKLPATDISGDGKLISVPVVVKNIGNVALPVGQKINIEIDAFDGTTTTPIKTLTAQSVSSLGVNASATFTASVTLPMGLATGTYNLVAVADSSNLVTESNENNNTVTSSGTIAVTRGYVDLTGLFGTTWTLPSGVVAGKALTGSTSVVVKNIGNVALPTGQNVNIVILAHDTTAANPDITLLTLANQSVSALAAGGSKTFIGTISHAAGLPADSYQILANITPVQAMTEEHTNNNQASQTALGATKTITSTPPFVDLSGVFGTLWTLPATIVHGKALLGYTSVVVKNAGNVALPTGQTVNIVVIAHDTTNTNNPDITLITLANQSVSALAAGGTKQFNAYVNRSAGLPADHYQIEATITPVQALTESDLTDNTVLKNALGSMPGITVS